MAKKSSTDLVLVAFGIIAWVVAGMFGALPLTVDAEVGVAGGTARVKTPSLAAAGAACGFAVAGGLCFLGAAVASRPERGKPDA